MQIPDADSPDTPTQRVTGQSAFILRDRMVHSQCIIQESQELGANIVHKSSDIGASKQPGRFTRLTMVPVEGLPRVHRWKHSPTTRKLEVCAKILPIWL